MSRPLSVLMIEDSADDAELLAIELRQGGFEPQIRRVETAEQLTEALAGTPPEVVIADYNLPGLGAAQALEAVRRSNPDLPYLVVSGVVNAEQAVELMRAGAQDFLDKNDLARLVPAVERELDEAERKRQLRKAERDLRESERRNRAVLENIVDGVITMDADGIIRAFSQGAVAIFGHQAEDVIGQPIELLMPEPFDRRHGDFLKEHMGKSGASVANFGREVVGRRKDGSTFPMHLGVGETETAEGRMFIGTARDISDLKRMSEELAQAQKMEAVGRLTGGVAHDFNNLLMIIISNLELLGDEINGNDDLESLIEAATSAAERGADVTQRLLAFSRRQSLMPEAIAIRELVEDTVKLLRPAIEETVEIRSIVGDIVSAPLADRGHLQNALVNLAMNACDAMPDGGTLTIEIGDTRLTQVDLGDDSEAKPGEFVMVDVSDTGKGIANDVIDRVFEPFFTTKGMATHSGLGLSMVYGFVRQTGGHLEISSTPSRGTSVQLYLPVAENMEKQTAKRRRPALPGGEETLMLVEDDHAVRGALGRLLTKLGYAVIEAASGPAAIEACKDGAIDLLITDVVMPGGMSGPDLAREFADRQPGIKILYISGYAERLVADKSAADLGARFLGKPFRKELFAKTIREILDD